MTTYTATAKRAGKYWELHIDGVGVTQTRNLAKAEHMVRDYVALTLGVAANSFDVEITPQVSADLIAASRKVRRELAEAAEAQRQAASNSRKVVARLEDAGLTGQEIAIMLQVSPQRVSQLSRRDRHHHQPDQACT